MVFAKSHILVDALRKTQGSELMSSSQLSTRGSMPCNDSGKPRTSIPDLNDEIMFNVDEQVIVRPLKNTANLRENSNSMNTTDNTENENHSISYSRLQKCKFPENLLLSDLKPLKISLVDKSPKSPVSEKYRILLSETKRADASNPLLIKSKEFLMSRQGIIFI